MTFFTATVTGKQEVAVEVCRCMEEVAEKEQTHAICMFLNPFSIMTKGFCNPTCNDKMHHSSKCLQSPVIRVWDITCDTWTNNGEHPWASCCNCKKERQDVALRQQSIPTGSITAWSIGNKWEILQLFLYFNLKIMQKKSSVMEKYRNGINFLREEEKDWDLKWPSPQRKNSPLRHWAFLYLHPVTRLKACSPAAGLWHRNNPSIAITINGSQRPASKYKHDDEIN